MKWKEEARNNNKSINLFSFQFIIQVSQFCFENSEFVCSPSIKNELCADDDSMELSMTAKLSEKSLWI